MAHWPLFVLEGAPSGCISVRAPGWIVAMGLAMAELGIVLDAKRTTFARLGDGRMRVQAVDGRQFTLLRLPQLTDAANDAHYGPQTRRSRS